jgi:hypothetical protein
MIMTKTMLVIAVLFYAFLWALYAGGATVLLAPLLIPAILAVMVALGIALQRFIGIEPRKQHFDDGSEKTEK